MSLWNETFTRYMKPKSMSVMDALADFALSDEDKMRVFAAARRSLAQADVRSFDAEAARFQVPSNGVQLEAEMQRIAGDTALMKELRSLPVGNVESFWQTMKPGTPSSGKGL